MRGALERTNAYDIWQTCSVGSGVVRNSSRRGRACPKAGPNDDPGTGRLSAKVAADSAAGSDLRRVAEEDECSAAGLQPAATAEPNARPTDISGWTQGDDRGAVDGAAGGDLQAPAEVRVGYVSTKAEDFQGQHPGRKAFGRLPDRK